MPEPRYPLVRYLATESGYVTRVRRALELASRQVSADILTAGNGAVEGRLAAQRAAIQSHMGQAWDSIESAVHEGQRAAIDEAAEVLATYQEELLGAFELDPEIKSAILTSEAVRAQAGVQAVAARAQFSRRELASTVWGAQAAANSKLDKIIDSALARGLSQRELAAQVRQFVNPATPGGASYAAMRIARTEINNAYHASSVESYKRSKMVEKVKWNLSSSHPEGDICDDYATDSPYDVNEVPEKPHPHCFCFTTAELPSREQFIDDLFSGKYDDDLPTGAEPESGGIVERQGRGAEWGTTRQRTYNAAANPTVNRWARQSDPAVRALSEVAGSEERARRIAGPYTGLNGDEINKWLAGLRHQTKVVTEAARQATDELVETLKAVRTTEAVSVYRNAGSGVGWHGQKIDTEADLDELVGQEFEVKGIMSTSYPGTEHRFGTARGEEWSGSVGDADEYSWGDTFDNLPFFRQAPDESVHMRVHIPAGHPAARIDDLSQSAHENEIIMPPGTRYRVLGWTTIEGPRGLVRFIDVEVLPWAE